MDKEEILEIINRNYISPHYDVWTFYLKSATRKKCPICQKNIMNKNNHNGTDTEGSWERSHIISKDNGGNDNISNVIPTCWQCNRSGNNKNIVDFIEEQKYKSNKFEELMNILSNNKSISEQSIKSTSKQSTKSTSKQPDKSTSKQPNKSTSKQPKKSTSKQSNKLLSKKSNKLLSKKSIKSASK